MNKKLVYICSPLKGDLAANMAKAVDYAKSASEEGVIPLAPHTIFTQFLNDMIPEERQRGLKLGIDLLKRCDEIWVYENKLSGGMKNEIVLAYGEGKPVIAKQMSHETYTEFLALQNVFKASFNQQQWAVICQGMDQGLNPRIFANSRMEASEMDEIVQGLQAIKNRYLDNFAATEHQDDHTASIHPINDQNDYDYAMEALG
ncbi:DUF7768 domain-containing protein [Acetobacterium woodii]|uniref:DUF7768 domain-containing protein n=1 Tax=Acetobacterium woodii (strain ATCC 29683 / DSM 1030 / JCM 2381 / KCTC 1655 / WB1) TaxID=931626 RepID=H6LDE0_ACEWD|nr:DUF4406 domain-containing protein [Acetobacterium woodii]AFA47912.1 hypothetical protein Awo_c11280 [Acetobacterium woodii DSM 1030]